MTQTGSPTSSSLGCKTLDIEHFPPFMLQNTKDPLPELTRYLKSMVDEEITGPKKCLMLPSVLTLSAYFDVMPEEVMIALREIKEQGYYNISGGLYGHVSLYGKNQRQQWPNRAKQSFSPGISL